MAHGAGQPEADGALDGPVDGGVPALRCPQPEGAGGGPDVEVEPVGLAIQSVGHQPEEPGGRRAEDPEPELLDVAGAGVMADSVDDRDRKSVV